MMTDVSYRFMPEATPEAAVAAYELSGGTFWSVVLASALVVALAIEQIYVFWGLVSKTRALGSEVGKALFHGDLPAARTVCERSSSPVADIFIAALNKVSRPGHSVRRAAERERQRFRLWMRRRLWALGTVGALAPFVGLFGTVVGIIQAFSDIAASDAGGFAVVAGGVSHALWATAGGILIAIQAASLYNVFQAHGNSVTVEVKLVVDEFVEQLEVAVERGAHDGRRLSSLDNNPNSRAEASSVSTPAAGMSEV